jgi:hypothetical protein
MKTIYIITIVLIALNVVLWLLTRWFDKELYIPFQKRMGIKPVEYPLYNPGLLRLGVLTAIAGAAVYVVVFWLVF